MSTCTWSMFFIEPTLQLVVKHLQGLTQWFSLGIHLDVPYPQVKAYCRQYGDDDQRGLTEVINTWIKNGEASWPSLAVALKGIGEIDRAKQIATEYGMARSCAHAIYNACISCYRLQGSAFDFFKSMY